MFPRLFLAISVCLSGLRPRDPALAAGLSAAGLYSDPVRTAKRETGRAGA